MFLKHFRLIGGLPATLLVLSLNGLSAYAADGTPPPATAASPTSPASTLPATVNPVPPAGIPGHSDGSCPETAPFKVSKSGIYHVPADPNYKNTKAKQCFANAQAAEQAGYRAPRPSVKGKP